MGSYDSLLFSHLSVDSQQICAHQWCMLLLAWTYGASCPAYEAMSAQPTVIPSPTPADPDHAAYPRRRPPS